MSELKELRVYMLGVAAFAALFRIAQTLIGGDLCVEALRSWNYWSSWLSFWVSRSW